MNAAANYSYDSMGRLLGESYCVPQNCSYSITVMAGYDLAGNMTGLMYPDTRNVGQSFDSANRLNGVNFTSWNRVPEGSSYYSISSFAPPGEPTNATMGNGVGISSSFNPRQSIASLSYANANGPIWSKQFSWDQTGSNLLLMADAINGNGRLYSYDTLNRIVSAQDLSSVRDIAATAAISISGSEQSITLYYCGQYHNQACYPPIYDAGSVSLTIGGTTVNTGYYSGCASTCIATALANAVNGAGSLPVTATANGSTVVLTAKTAGPSGNGIIVSASVTDSASSLFSNPSYSVGPTKATTAGGSFAGPLLSGGLNETYAYDPFGNLTQTPGFSQSFNSYNEINGYSYDPDGDQNTDSFGHTLAFDPSGMLSSVAGGQETYVYDAEGNRVEVNGATVTDTIYFGGVPVAMLTGGAYTDMIYAGSSLIAEANGTGTTYRLTDSIGSLAGNPSGSGLNGAVNYAPYGQLFSGSPTDSFGFTGLQWDPTTATNHATYRQFSPQQGRWQSPDPYPGSYNWADPQSLNRYTYVNGRPMAFTDPSGQDFLDIFLPMMPMGLDIVGTILAPNILVDFLNRSNFHGSLRERPSANPWNDKFGVPYGGLGNGVQQALGLPTMADVGCNPICDATHDESDTRAILQQAYLGSTAGRLGGLTFMWNMHRTAKAYDFHYNRYRGDTFTLCGWTMTDSEMGNFIAGFDGAVYDKRYFWTTGSLGLNGAQRVVEYAGYGYHLTGQTDAVNDPWDHTGMPAIKAGEAFGWNWHGPNSACGNQ
jgi:RHS repeat-associated protein